VPGTLALGIPAPGGRSWARAAMSLDSGGVGSAMPPGYPLDEGVRSGYPTGDSWTW